MKIDFTYEEIQLDYKDRELYSRVLVDTIAPYYFVVIRESKYHQGLDKLKDNFMASVEYQPFAYSIKDFKISKANTLTGIVRNFVDLKTAEKWLRNKVKDNFILSLKE